ncbi:MAG: hypothetical protein L0Y78_10345 [candidate division NC10 bacterium]|nr:hypothetical protein [candidate division NC10 bacterium]
MDFEFERELLKALSYLKREITGLHPDVTRADLRTVYRHLTGRAVSDTEAKVLQAFVRERFVAAPLPGNSRCEKCRNERCACLRCMWGEFWRLDFDKVKLSRGILPKSLPAPPKALPSPFHPEDAR